MRESRVIVSIGDDDAIAESVVGLMAKWSRKPGRTASDCIHVPVDIKDPLSLPGKFISSVSSESAEIVIVSHGSAIENTALFHSDEEKLSLSVLADLIALLIDPKSLATAGNPVLKLNLVSCFAAYKKDPGVESLAESLHRLLHERGMYTEITARASVVRVEVAGNKSTFSMADRDRVISDMEADKVLEEKPVAWYDIPMGMIRDVSKYLSEKPAVTEVHAPGSKLVFFSDPAATEYTVLQRDAVARQSMVQKARSTHAVKVLAKHWRKYTAAVSGVKPQYQQVYDFIKQEVQHRRFSSYSVLVEHIEEIMGNYGLLSTGGLLRMFIDPHAGFRNCLLNSIHEINELLDLSENSNHLMHS